MATLYDVLGVAPGADVEVIAAAYRAMMKKHHPDLGGGGERAKAINDAYAVLSDPDRRGAYNLTLRQPFAPSAEPPRPKPQMNNARKRSVFDIIILIITLPLRLIGFAATVLISLAIIYGIATGVYKAITKRSPEYAPYSNSWSQQASEGGGSPAVPESSSTEHLTWIAGKWAAQGLSCDSPIVIAITNGAVSMTVAGTTSTAAIEPSPMPGVIDARGADGGKYVYTLAPNGSLSMLDPANQTMNMTKCADGVLSARMTNRAR